MAIPVSVNTLLEGNTVNGQELNLKRIGILKQL